MAEKHKAEELADAYKCEECEALVAPEDGDDTGPLYECDECGTRFDKDSSLDGCSHRCPDCGRFARRAADRACPECGTGELLPLYLGAATAAGPTVRETAITRAAEAVVRVYRGLEPAAKVYNTTTVKSPPLKAAMDELTYAVEYDPAKGGKR